MSARTARAGVGGHAPSKDILLGAKGVCYPTSVPEGILIGIHGQMYTEKLAARSTFAHTNSSTIRKGKSHGGHVFGTDALNTKKPKKGIVFGPKSLSVVSKEAKDVHV
jgi:hypothetical protein